MHDGHSPHHHHCHDHDVSGASREEAVALLGYMVAHNEHHTEELAELAETMRAMDLVQAAEEIESSLADLREGNLKLRAAYALLKD